MRPLTSGLTTVVSLSPGPDYGLISVIPLHCSRQAHFTVTLPR